MNWIREDDDYLAGIHRTTVGICSVEMWEYKTNQQFNIRLLVLGDDYFLAGCYRGDLAGLKRKLLSYSG